MSIWHIAAKYRGAGNDKTFSNNGKIHQQRETETQYSNL